MKEERKDGCKNYHRWSQPEKTDIIISTASFKRFWRGTPIDRNTFILICQRVGVNNWEEIVDNTPLEQRDSRQELLPVGREKDIEYLSQLVNSGNKVIIIQGIGGVGKTTLAKSFFQFRGLKYLELIIAREISSIKPIEDAIDALLPELEEPSRNFRGKLQQLKLQLQTRKFGILIDNLEPALDKHGKFIEPHRDYLDLLRVLSDVSVQSVTLITSREFIEEPGVTFEQLH